jgi:hypothetical protein
MIDKIISIGDSFLAGAELTYPLPDTELTAPALLAKKYNKKFLNLAVPGIGLQLATNILLEQIEKQVIDGNTLIVFCLSPVGRIDFIPKELSDDFKTTLDYRFFQDVEAGKYSKERLTDNFKGVTGIYTYLKDTIDFYQMGELHYLAFISLLKNLVPICDFKIITFFGFQPYFMNSTNHNHYVKINFKEDVLSDTGFVHWAESNNFHIHKYGHPGKEAHAELSKIIEHKVFEKYGKIL